MIKKNGGTGGNLLFVIVLELQYKSKTSVTFKKIF